MLLYNMYYYTIAYHVKITFSITYSKFNCYLMLMYNNSILQIIVMK